MSHESNYLHEVGMLARTPRSGFQFLGSGDQSVAEHSFRMLHVAFLLARRSAAPVDELHLLHLVMFHDLPEARTMDQNYVAHKYVTVNEDRLYADLARELPHGETIVALVQEFEARQTPAARLAFDADQIEFLLMLKEQGDLGNPRVEDWVTPLLARLITPEGKDLAGEIMAAPSDAWWFGNKTDPHWVHHGRQT